MLYKSWIALEFNYYRSNAFEVTSMDEETSVVLFFGDSNEDLQEWYESVHYNISSLNQQEVTITILKHFIAIDITG